MEAAAHEYAHWRAELAAAILSHHERCGCRDCYSEEDYIGFLH